MNTRTCLNVALALSLAGLSTTPVLAQNAPMCMDPSQMICGQGVGDYGNPYQTSPANDQTFNPPSHQTSPYAPMCLDASQMVCGQDAGDYQNRYSPYLSGEDRLRTIDRPIEHDPWGQTLVGGAAGGILHGPMGAVKDGLVDLGMGALEKLMGW
jgi:hypothetical protein